MMTLNRPITLIAARPQAVWGPRAVVNFAGGGLGAGFYLVAVLLSEFRPSPAVTLASWLGPSLVLAGFAAVATEAGRPLRGMRVLARPASSWMSRELWLGGAFVLLAGAEFVVPASGLRVLAAVAAGWFALAQGLILRKARAVAAWDVAVLPLVFVTSAILSGTALYVLAQIRGGQTPSPALLGSLLAEVAFAALVWRRYLTSSVDEAFTQATRELREGATAMALAGAGYVVPFGLVSLSLALPDQRTATAGLAALLVIAGQVHAKAALVLVAGRLRPITFAHLGLHRRPS